MTTNRNLNILSLLFIIVGAVLTLENYHIIHGISRLWPTLILLLGIGFILLFFERLRSDGVLLWIGIFLCLLSTFFFYLNFTSWSKMVQMWPFFLGIVGVSFFSLHVFLMPVNSIFLYLSLAFSALCVIFFLVFSVSTALWPTALIIFGSSLAIINYYSNK